MILRFFQDDLEDAKKIIKKICKKDFDKDLLAQISCTVLRCGYTPDLHDGIFRYYHNFGVVANIEIIELINKCINVNEILEQERSQK